MLGRMFAFLGFHRWEDIDGDGPFTLQECAWTGERRTVIKGRHLRLLYPGMKPRWEA